MAESEITLSRALLETLLEQGLTLSKVAQVLELQASEITRVKQGEREFKANHLLVLARYLQLPLAGLLAKAMAPYSEHKVAGERLAALLHEVTSEVEDVLKMRRGQDSPRTKHPVLSKS